MILIPPPVLPNEVSLMELAATISRVKLSDGVVEHVKSLIAAGRLRPGDKLPPEREFAATLGVSRTALREAIRSLSLMGLINVRHGEGTFVSALVAGSFMKPLSPMLSMSSADLLELIEARRIIESKAVGLCALRASADEVSSIRLLADEMASNTADLEQFNQLDLDFHMALASGSHNSVLAAILETVRDAMYEQVQNVQRLPGAAGRASDFHLQIASAVAEGDDVRAEQVMLDHLNDVESAVLSSTVEHARQGREM